MKIPVTAVALLLSALAPAAAAAEPAIKVEPEALRDALPVTEIIGDEVRTADGREFGDVEEIVLDSGGEVAYYAVEAEMDVYEDFVELMNEEIDVDYERASETGAARNDGSDSGGAGDDDNADGAIRIDPRNISFNEHGEAIIGNLDRREVFRDSLELGVAEEEGNLAASQLVGRNVNLADEESFGTVENVMISRDGDKAVAMVVDNWNLLDKQRRALPVMLQTAEDDELTYPFTEEQVRTVEEFDLENE